MGAGLVRHRQGQERPREALVAGEGEPLQVVRMVARGHGEQVPHPHRLQVGAGIRRGILREVGKHRVVDREPSLRRRQPDARGGEALAEGEEHVGIVLLVGRPPPFGHHGAVPHDHEAVQRVDLRLGGVDEGEQRGRGDALRLRAASGQAGRLVRRGRRQAGEQEDRDES